MLYFQYYWLVCTLYEVAQSPRAYALPARNAVDGKMLYVHEAVEIPIDNKPDGTVGVCQNLDSDRLLATKQLYKLLVSTSLVVGERLLVNMPYRL